MSLWNDKRTPPGVYTDSRTGMSQSGMGSTPPAPKSWSAAAPVPTARERFDKIVDAQKPSKTVAERAASKMSGQDVVTKRGDKLRAKGKLKPLR